MDTVRFRPDWLTFGRFAGFTTVLTLTLIMLGVYTSATGSGLACSAQWPLCDDGLLPQTVPSFIEWFHRLIAMITGFFILGTALWAWRGPAGRRTRAAASLAAVLLPLQISIGAVTVTLNGLLPNGYAPTTQGAHLVVALTIFASLVLTSLLAADGSFVRPPLRRARSALIASLAILPAVALFSRIGGPLSYTPAAQATFIGASLALFATLLAATVWLGRSRIARVRALTGGGLALVFATMLLGRDLLAYTATVRAANAAILALAGLLIAAAVLIVYRSDGGRAFRRRATGN